MIDPLVLLTILGMASVTYMTRIGGFLLLRGKSFGPRLTAMMETAPGCVLVTVIAPHFVTGKPADLIVLAVTISVASRLPLLAVVLLAVGLAGALRFAIA